MKTIQKLEFVSGVFTFLFALPNIYLTYIFFADWIRDSKTSIEEVLVGPILFLVTPALLVFIGVVFQTLKQWKIGFVIIFISGGWLTFTHLLGFLLGSVFNGYLLLGILPGLFAFTTIILAFFNLILTLNKSKELSQIDMV